jgi:hypothetical protein
MRPLSTYKLLLTSFFVCLAVISLFVLNKRLYASAKEGMAKDEAQLQSEMPWEGMTFQFVGSVLFK